MKKSKILAFAISAISTGILISCVKPTEENSNIDDKTKAKPSDKTTADSAKSEVVTEPVNKHKNTNDSTGKNTPAVTAIELPSEKTTLYLQHVNKDIIVPLYQESAKQSKALNDRATELCKSGNLSDEQVAELRTQWLAVATAWAKAEAVNFGPSNENMANLYINYFPDERGLVHKSVKRLITDNPELNPEQLIDESAIVQGVPALEDILYTNDTLDKAQCNYLVSASTELNRRFTEIATKWENDGNTLLDTENAVTGMNQFFNGLLFYIENLKSTGIDKPLALNSKQKGHVPAHVAGKSRAIITAKLDILNKALSDVALKNLIGNNPDGEKVLAQITTTIAETQTQIDTLPADIGKAEKNQQVQLYDNLTMLTKQIKRGVMPLLGVQLGFNSTDGD